MTLKEILLLVDDSIELSNDILNFTPIEKALMLKIGSECLIEGRKAISSLTQTDIYNKLKEETKKDIEKLELDLLVEKKLKSEMEEQLKKIYESQLEKMKHHVSELQTQIFDFSNDNSILIKNAVENEKEKIKSLLEDKEKIIKNLTDVLTKQNETKTSKIIGDEGELIFEKLANTFRDFQDYKIINKSKTKHKGDYHLFFKDFNVLVDSKNYSTNVYSQELDKIEHDLITNETMDFAWIISLKTNFGDWNKLPIMYKWVLTEMGTKCIIIINKLLSYANPEDILRNAWGITNELNILLKKTAPEENEIKLLKKRDYNLVQQIKGMQKKVCDLKRCVSSMNQTTKEIDTDLLDALSVLTNEIIKDEFNKYNELKDWWEKNVEYDETNSEHILLSSEIWNRIKKYNKEYIDELNITIDDLKNYITTYIDNDKYNKKSKNGAIELYGFKLIHTSNQLNLTNGVNKKNNKVSKIDCVIEENVQPISEELKKELIHEYVTNELNIMEISEKHNVLTWQLVSLLVNSKVITSRKVARGYDLYIKSDYYQNKVNKKHNEL